jgi:hypothetical protein
LMLKEKDFNSIPLLSGRWRDDNTISISRPIFGIIKSLASSPPNDFQSA